MSIITERASQLSQGLARRVSIGEKELERAVQHAADQLSLSGSRAGQSIDHLVLTNATHHNVVNYLHGAEESFQAILDSLSQAKKSFHIETFIWHDDHTGRKLADALIDKVKAAESKGEKFDAKVLIDGIGVGSNYGTEDMAILKHLNDNGVEARLFNRNYVSLTAMGIPLTHRKIYLADGERYLVGGRNVGDEYFQKTYEHKFGDPTTKANSYNDFLMGVHGDEAARVQTQFYKNWKNAGGTVPAETPRPVPAPDGHTRLQTFVTDPHTGEQGVREAHFKAIQNAKQEIMVISPYFADDGLVESLIAAKQQNVAARTKLYEQTRQTVTRRLGTEVNPEQIQQAVDKAVPELKVKALMPLSGEKGKDLNYEMDMLTARKLLNAGIEVRLSTGGVENGQAISRFSHFKGMVVDDQLLSIGSANADYRTYHSNHEIVNMVADRTKVREFQRNIAQPDWNSATPIDLAWLDRNTSFKERVLRRVGDWLSFLY